MNKSIFDLKEGKVYKVYKDGYPLNRKFRVNNGELENNGLGHFAPCD